MKRYMHKNSGPLEEKKQSTIDKLMLEYLDPKDPNAMKYFVICTMNDEIIDYGEIYAFSADDAMCDFLDDSGIVYSGDYEDEDGEFDWDNLTRYVWAVSDDEVLPKTDSEAQAWLDTNVDENTLVEDKAAEAPVTKITDDIADAMLSDYVDEDVNYDIGEDTKNNKEVNDCFLIVKEVPKTDTSDPWHDGNMLYLDKQNGLDKYKTFGTLVKKFNCKISNKLKPYLSRRGTVFTVNLKNISNPDVQLFKPYIRTGLYDNPNPWTYLYKVVGAKEDLEKLADYLEHTHIADYNYFVVDRHLDCLDEKIDYDTWLQSVPGGPLWDDDNDYEDDPFNWRDEDYTLNAINFEDNDNYLIINISNLNQAKDNPIKVEDIAGDLVTSVLNALQEESDVEWDDYATDMTVEEHSCSIKAAPLEKLSRDILCGHIEKLFAFLDMTEDDVNTYRKFVDSQLGANTLFYKIPEKYLKFNSLAAEVKSALIYDLGVNSDCKVVITVPKELDVEFKDESKE